MRRSSLPLTDTTSGSCMRAQPGVSPAPPCTPNDSHAESRVSAEPLVFCRRSRLLSPPTLSFRGVRSGALAEWLLTWKTCRAPRSHDLVVVPVVRSQADIIACLCSSRQNRIRMQCASNGVWWTCRNHWWCTFHRRVVSVATSRRAACRAVPSWQACVLPPCLRSLHEHLAPEMICSINCLTVMATGSDTTFCGTNRSATFWGSMTGTSISCIALGE